MNTKKILLGAFVVLIGLGLSSFTDKDDDRNFQVAKNLDIFNAGNEQPEGDDYREIWRYRGSNPLL